VPLLLEIKAFIMKASVKPGRNEWGGIFDQTEKKIPPPIRVVLADASSHHNDSN
jgi:hypothetical protein